MKKQGIWVVVSVLVVLGLILASCAKAPAPVAPTTPTTPVTPAAPAKPAVIKWQTQYLMAASPKEARFPMKYSEDMTMFLNDWLEDVSEGQLQIETAPMGSVVPQADMMTAVKKGTLDFSSNYAAFYSGIIPEGNVEMGLPFAWDNPGEVMDALYQQGLAKMFEEVYGEHNIWPVIWSLGAIQGLGGYVGMNTSPAFFKGKVIRAVGIWQKWVQALGGKPVTLAFGETYMALKLGTVEGYIAGANALDSIKLKEVLDSWVVYPNSIDFGLPFLFNQDSLNALPPALKRRIQTDVKYVLEFHTMAANYNWNRWTTVNAEQQGYIKQIRYSEEDAKYVRDVGLGLWDGVAALTPRTAKMVDIVKKQMRDLGKM